MSAINLKAVAKLLQKNGFNVRAVAPVTSKKSKVCRVDVDNASSLILKLWPFYPLRFIKIRCTKQWWQEYRWKCKMPFNEVRINEIVRNKVGLVTPKIYVFKRIFPFKSLRYGYLMLQEDLGLRGFRNLEDLLKQFVAQKEHDQIDLLVERVASIIKELYSHGIFNEDIHFRNFMVNAQNEFALIDFERCFICNDAKEKLLHLEYIFACCRKHYRQIAHLDTSIFSV